MGGEDGADADWSISASKLFRCCSNSARLAPEALYTTEFMSSTKRMSPMLSPPFESELPEDAMRTWISV